MRAKKNNIANEKTDISQEIKSIAFENVSAAKIPRTKGQWTNSEKPGDSEFVLDDEADFVYNNKKSGKKVHISGKEIKEKMLSSYGTDRVHYNRNEPDFSPFADVNVGIIEIENFPSHRTGIDGTYNCARKITADRMGCTLKQVDEYMTQNGLSWHECGDRRTIIAIPSLINEVFVHTGGIGVGKSFEAVARGIAEQWGQIKLIKKKECLAVNHLQIAEAKKENKKLYRKIRSNM